MRRYKIILIIFLLILTLQFLVSCDFSGDKNKDIFEYKTGHWLGGVAILDTEGVHNNYTIKSFIHTGEKIAIIDSGACEGNFTGTLTIDGDFLLNSGAFIKNDITKLVLGKKVDIGWAVFTYNDKLKDIVVDKKNPYLYVKNHCLISTEKSKYAEFNGGCSVVLATNDSVIPNEVDSISSAAFSGLTKIKEIIIPDSVTTIDLGIIYGCTNLERLYIGKNVKKIYENSFSGCPKLNIEIDPENPYFRVEGNCIIKKEGNVLWTAFDKSVIPEGVTSIRTGAFYCNNDITDIIFPDSLTAINGSIIACNGIKTIYIPKAVKTIDCEFISNFGHEDEMDFTIYCEAEEKPEGWIDEWQIGATNVHWGVSREEYESIISQNS